MSMQLENTTFNAFHGEQDDPANRLFLGFLHCTVAIDEARFKVRDVRVTVFFNQGQPRISFQFPCKVWDKQGKDVYVPLVRLDDTTYQWMQKEVAALRSVQRAFHEIQADVVAMS